MKYYVMESEGEYPSLSIEKGPRLIGGPWYHGQKLTIEVSGPLEYFLEEDNSYDEYSLDFMHDCEAFPLMHKSLLSAIQSAGVNNLEIFPATIYDPNNGKVINDYVAFNVIGLVSAADLESSALMHEDAKASLLDTDFDSLVIDETKTMGVHLFRLAENCSAICISEKVKEAIEKHEIPGMVFYGPGEWSG